MQFNIIMEPSEEGGYIVDTIISSNNPGDHIFFIGG